MMVGFGLVNASLIFVLIYKWGLIDKVKPRSKFWVEFWNCDFCKGFWLASMQCCVAFLFEPNPWLAIVPFGAAMITSRVL